MYPTLTCKSYFQISLKVPTEPLFSYFTGKDPEAQRGCRWARASVLSSFTVYHNSSSQSIILQIVLLVLSLFVILKISVISTGRIKMQKYRDFQICGSNFPSHFHLVSNLVKLFRQKLGAFFDLVWVSSKDPVLPRGFKELMINLSYLQSIWHISFSSGPIKNWVEHGSVSKVWDVISPNLPSLSMPLYRLAPIQPRNIGSTLWQLQSGERCT